MEQGWTSILDAAASLYLFALGTQCIMAAILSLLFFSIARAAEKPQYFDCWKNAWLVRAIGLAAILVRFLVPMAQGARPSSLDGTLFSFLGYGVYQACKLLYAWWLLEGTLRFVGSAPRPSVSRWAPFVAGTIALASVLLLKDVNKLLVVQAPALVAVNVVSAWSLLRAPRSKRSPGTSLTAVVLLFHAALWVVYAIAFSRPDWGPWPLVRTAWSLIAFHNSYFDLAFDVLIASGMVVLLLQDATQRQLEAESERARLRAELARTERLRSLGKLVSGVAHELNNPLTSILGFAEALELPGDEEQGTRYARVIREQALRCRRIVRGLSTFSGKESDALEHVDVHEVLERVVSGFELELAQCEVRVELATPAPARSLTGDRFALEQLFTNLVSNAFEVSPRGGTLRVTTRATADELEIAVEDEGPGIAAEILGHVFDPFFTTKAPGQGMGLGLAVAHGIVHAHGGRIRAENRVPSGARFVVTLPLAGRPAQELPQKELPHALGQRDQKLALLVIDDERSVREMLTALGSRRGWRVTCAVDSKDGLARLRGAGQSFDVVLCDLYMPSPSGIEIHDRIEREAPELLERFLFITGDLASSESSAFARRCRQPIVSKPFRFEDLARSIEARVQARALTRP